MKKKIILILLSIFVLILSYIILVWHKDNYIISIEKIDNFSPDRKLIVYKNEKEIEFKELQYTDGTYLCSKKNPTVSYSEIIGITELIVKLDEKRQIVAKIVEK